MKSNLYILTLFLLIQTGFGEEESYKPFEPQGISGYTVNFMHTNNQNSLSFGVKAVTNRRLNFQINPICFDWQTSDIYNNGNTSYSFILPLTYLGFSGLYSLTEELLIETNKNETTEWRKLLILPLTAILITNSKYNHKLNSITTSENSFLFTSLFMKTKLDYFNGKDQNWWRWKPGFGLELSQVFGKRYISNSGICGVEESEAIYDLKKSYGISLELGLENPIDFGVANPQSHKLTPYVNFILMKGF